MEKINKNKKGGMKWMNDVHWMRGASRWVRRVWEWCVNRDWKKKWKLSIFLLFVPEEEEEDGDGDDDDDDT